MCHTGSVSTLLGCLCQATKKIRFVFRLLCTRTSASIWIVTVMPEDSYPGPYPAPQGCVALMVSQQSLESMCPLPSHPRNELSWTPSSWSPRWSCHTTCEHSSGKGEVKIMGRITHSEHSTLNHLHMIAILDQPHLSIWDQITSLLVTLKNLIQTLLINVSAKTRFNAIRIWHALRAQYVTGSCLLEWPRMPRKWEEESLC